MNGDACGCWHSLQAVRWAAGSETLRAGRHGCTVECLSLSLRD